MAGVNHSLTVTAFDAFNNVADGYTGTITFTSTDGQAVLPGDYTFVGGDNGTRVFSGVNLRTVGTPDDHRDRHRLLVHHGRSGRHRRHPGGRPTSFTVTGYPSPVDLRPTA